MTTPLQYEVRMDPRAHEFLVRLVLVGGSGPVVRLTLPAWIPGSYMIRDFARNITEISASDESGRLQLTKLDKQTWEVAPQRGELTVDYRVYAFDLSVRSAYLDTPRGYFNGTSLFLLPSGHSNSAWQVLLAAPDDLDCADWRVYTSMPVQAVDEAGFGRYQGRGYDSLIDYPVEIGHARSACFEVSGRPHQVVVSDGGNFDIERIARDLSPICREHAAMFGELPVERYVFLVLATGEGYGGLEHLDSTSLVCKRSDLPAHGLDRPDKAYRQFLGLCSHEYFHLWNVKRIRPARLAGADLSEEVHTELLWAFEGITSYYDDLALVRSGTVTTEEYLELLAAIVTRVQRGPGRLRQSVAASSFDAWTRFYKQDENAPNAIVSYYAKGALVAFGLDVTMRRLSDDRLCLDDLMRALWQRYGRSDSGVPERAIEGVVAELLGRPVDDFFADFVYGTAELPLADWFDAFGVGLRLRAAESAEDLGGCRAEPSKEPPVPNLGARLESRPGGVWLTQVIADGPAQRAGLCAGDQLLAIEGERVSEGNLAGLLRRARDGAVQADFFRRDRLLQTRIVLGDPPADTCDLWPLPAAQLSPAQQQRRTAWLASTAVQ
jgi:predicted metalloprotease with PDZ domain